MSNADISEIINNLVDSFGVREDLPLETDNEVMSLYKNGEYSKCIKVIKEWFHFEKSIRIGYINDNGGDVNLKCREIDLLGCKDGIKINQKNPMSIILAENVSEHGTNTFDELEVTMLIRRSFLKEIAHDLFMVGVAHELSHLLLESTNHALRKNEIAVDVFSMVMGFNTILFKARKFYPQHRVGYMSNSQLVMAYREIRNRQSEKYGKKMNTTKFMDINKAMNTLRKMFA